MPQKSATRDGVASSSSSSAPAGKIAETESEDVSNDDGDDEESISSMSSSEERELLLTNTELLDSEPLHFSNIDGADDTEGVDLTTISGGIPRIYHHTQIGQCLVDVLHDMMSEGKASLQDKETALRVLEEEFHLAFRSLHPEVQDSQAKGENGRGKGNALSQWPHGSAGLFIINELLFPWCDSSGRATSRTGLEYVWASRVEICSTRFDVSSGRKKRKRRDKDELEDDGEGLMDQDILSILRGDPLFSKEDGDLEQRGPIIEGVHAQRTQNTRLALDRAATSYGTEAWKFTGRLDEMGGLRECQALQCSNLIRGSKAEMKSPLIQLNFDEIEVRVADDDAVKESAVKRNL
ncbi:hypothetical protein FOZ61_008297 [Perkinsus olseni]|uniref:Uncharacterized protein n=1 Tax=Perkinsus olseni TaxID=32597 RepID=A0A7J6M7P8_PEROL|nr:hypothetical protein FOZ61_008297 [Perkinsus olseni]